MNSQAPPRTRARWISTLFVLCLISSASAILSQFVYPREPTFVRYFGDFSWVELIINLGLFSLLLTAAILLRRWRREALWLVTTVFVLAGASAIRRLLTSDLVGLVDNFGLVGLMLLVFRMGVVFVLSGVIVAYAWGLKKLGALS